MSWYEIGAEEAKFGYFRLRLEARLFREWVRPNSDQIQIVEEHLEKKKFFSILQFQKMSDLRVGPRVSRPQ